MKFIKNSWFNIIGVAIPSIVAIPVMGYMARTLELEIFGLFSLALAFLGYSAVFDGGLSRAVIREVSIHRGNSEEIRLIVGSAARASVIIGLIVTLIIVVLSGKLTRMLNVSAEIFNDTQIGIVILGFIIPLVILSASLMALLEGCEEFGLINIIRSIGLSLVFLIPFLLTFYDQSFKSMSFGLFFARLIMLFLTYSLYIRSARFHPTGYSRSTLIRLYRFGGWLTISNIISPIMEYVDRFVLANIRGSATIIFYTAPAEMTTRLLSLPGAISRSLFPALSNNSENDGRALLLHAIRYQLILVTCTSAFVIIFASEILEIWLGGEFAVHSRDVLIWLMVGFFFNGLATIPYTHLQASGLARVTAMIHLAEVGPYLVLLVLLTMHLGMIGGAMAWSIRVLFDFILMSFFSWKNIYKENNHV